MPDRTMEVLRNFLCAYRLTNGLSQEEIAHRAGVSLPTYRRLEAFPRSEDTMPTPTLRTVMQLLRAIDAEAEFVAALDAVLDDALRGHRAGGADR